MENPKLSTASAQLIPVTPFDLVVFGAAGDLSLRKLIPSLFHRWRDGQIPADSRIIGASRTAMDDEGFRALARDSFGKFHPKEKIDAGEWAKFASLLHYAEVDAANANGGWPRLAEKLSGREMRQRVFYLALPPALYGDVSRNIDAAGLKSPGARIVLEKPIGK
ncbi:MAG TPA: glucose-6-phosphate dehydrogenase, partial [Parvularcula sp.]|nr:glucose-6-phosphate dehydrogenase [Parvularcula sp.]